MLPLDRLLAGLRQQHRMELPGGAACVPCYRVVADRGGLSAPAPASCAARGMPIVLSRAYGFLLLFSVHASNRWP